MTLDLAGKNCHERDMLIYKIFRPEEWQRLIDHGQTQGAPIDVTDGYIHFSTSEQVRETAAKHFANAGDLILVACDSDTMKPDMKWEVSRGGALFPHLYRLMQMDDVIWRKPLSQGDAGHIFPDDMT
jgi:uncharacterized protein (DUF952 family)